MTSVSATGSTFQIIALSPSGLIDPSIPAAASRSGCLGVLDLEYAQDLETALEAVRKLAGHGGKKGIKLAGENEEFIQEVLETMPSGISTVVFTAVKPGRLQALVEAVHAKNLFLILEVTSVAGAMEGSTAGADALLAKGNEAGGFVGEKTTFILLQQILSKTKLPVYAHGGIGLHSAAACYAAGAAGIVLDVQLLLTRESALPDAVKRHLMVMGGSEPRLFAENTDRACRIYVRPGSAGLEEVRKVLTCAAGGQEPASGTTTCRETILKNLRWDDAKNPFWLIGQDIGIAAGLARKYGTVGSIVRAFRTAVNDHVEAARKTAILQKNSPLAQSHGTRYPVVQGPMARITDTPAFALRVADEGGLPFIALSQLRGDEIRALLESVRGALADRPWGVGILGFNPEDLLREQVDALSSYSPPYAIVAGGLPNHVSMLESHGIASYVHVPSPDVLDLFLSAGCKRFIFEGRECGGHIGPRSSFVLWDVMTEKLLESLKACGRPEEYHLLYAGGIHDALSGSMAAAISAPLARAGMRVGVLMGTAYLLTPEIVESGAIVPEYQRKLLECVETSVLEFSPGHALRCCVTPLAVRFEERKRELSNSSVAGKKVCSCLEELIRGKSRIASKGLSRKKTTGGAGDKGPLVSVDGTIQHEEGLYMTGQLAALHNRTLGIRHLHEDVSVKACEKLASLPPWEAKPDRRETGPCDIAIIGMAGLFPKAGDLRTYWQNILTKKNSITEIPAERWDWRLYFDENRQAPDKIYSRWGGFMDDLYFDPTRYGLPPKSIESIDPMQLMALEVARRTLADAGYEDREFDRETASVILGASGGAGDVGVQYGVRSELPRFLGELPEGTARRLPEWTEDTFAGILLNVTSGRIANRLNLGGVNFVTDAACASSLAAIYQAIGELTSHRSNLVISGGVDTVQSPFGYTCFSKTQALSPRGCCSTFDAAADGIVISEGIAMVALKRLADAERDGDRIYAVIKGAGGSSDGKAKGLTAPLPAGQLRSMRRAYEQAGFGPETVGLFEAHGTGTVVGDTAELESTTMLLREAGSTPRQAAIGSVKTLIGHCKASAGVAGLIKASLALHHRVLPAHAGVNQPNPVLLQPDSPLYLVDQTLPWLSGNEQRRRAAVSAFGFGGTNFHLVLEEHSGELVVPEVRGPGKPWPSELLLWNGGSREELASALGHSQSDLEKTSGSSLAAIARDLARSYRRGSHTVAIVASDADDAVNKIRSAVGFLTGKTPALPAGVYHGEGTLRDGKVAVLFPGQGSQYTGMARETALHFPLFSETLSEADRVLARHFAHRFNGARLSHFIFPRGCYGEQAKADAATSLTGTDVAQPALGAMGAAYWKLMQSFGLRAHMAGGHSYGEFVALFAGEVIDLESLLLISEARGRLIVDTVKNAGGEFGTMAAIKASRQTVEKAIAGIDGIVIANHNAPRQCVISGATAAVEEAAARMSAEKMSISRLPVAAAFHSIFVKPAQAALAEYIKTTVWRKPGMPVYSNTSGEAHSGNAETIKAVMAEHLVKPVEFVAEINAMYRDGARVFLELGPKSVLTRLVSSTLGERPHTAIAVDSNGGGISSFLHAFGQLLCAGVPLDALKLFDGRLFDESTGVAALSEQELRKGWMLNGSRARRAGDEVRNVGISIDEVPTREAAAPEKAAVPMQPQRPDQDEFMRRRLASRKWIETVQRGGGKTMNENEPSVMAAYFEMMRQFLETQERIMSMHMGSSASPRRGVKMSRSMPGQAYGYAGCERNQGFTVEETAPIKPEIPRLIPMEAAPTPAPAAPMRANDKAAVPAAVIPAVMPEKASAAPSARPAEHLDRAKLSALLLGIIEEKTGYPPDMINADQNLEADLGIDSIKRVEIVGAFLKALPPVYGQTLGKNLGGLNTQPTLNGMLDVVEKVGREAGATVPFDHAGMRSTARAQGRSFRHVMKPKQEPVPASAARRLGPGRYIITKDTLKVAEKLCDLLRSRGCTVSLVERGMLQDEELLNHWCRAQKEDKRPIMGIIHLAPIGSAWLPADSPVQAWRCQLQLNEKSLFILLHAFAHSLSEEAHILSASSLGGLFDRQENGTAGLSLQGGQTGLLKSFSEERPEFRTKAVDVDPKESADSIAACLLTELELLGGRQEVGYPGGIRTIFETVAEPLPDGAADPGGLRGMVVLSTGGMKGVTAELLRELALPGNTLLVTGRSPLSKEDPEELKSLESPQALRDHFVAQVRSGVAKMNPAEIRKKVKSVLAAREMRNNLDDFKKRGAAVEYFAVDVTNEEALGQLIEGIHKKYGRITGVLHGAGIIEDKLLADKKSESWTRVVETKVLGLLLLQKYVRPESLRFFAVMSSVAGRYGNSGQSDYATANELMNRLCCQLRRAWSNKVNVKAFCWGPWGRTKFGDGMVTPEMEVKFEGKGVSLVTAEAGRGIFKGEISRRPGDQIEIICGEGPWEEREASIGRMRKKSSADAVDRSEHVENHAEPPVHPAPSL